MASQSSWFNPTGWIRSCGVILCAIMASITRYGSVGALCLRLSELVRLTWMASLTEHGSLICDGFAYAEWFSCETWLRLLLMVSPV